MSVAITQCDTAMLLAAGLGTRMRPLTDERPKPLVEVDGKPLIDHGLERLRAAGVKKAVVNVHYLADMLEAHLAKVTTPEIIISDERAELLETGGGLAKALPELGDKPFLVVNTDSVWVESVTPALTRLMERWKDDAMDCQLLVCPTVSSLGYNGTGDFNLLPDGRLERRIEREVAPFVFTGAYMMHPRLFKNAPEGKFSMNVLFDKAIKEGRLHGVRHDGQWLEINTPQSVDVASATLRDL